MAAALLIVVVPVSLRLIVMVHRLMVSMLNLIFSSSVSAPFVVTMLTLLLFAGTAWAWIQMVRSGFFGILHFGGGP